MTKPVNIEKFIAAVRELKNCWFADLIVASGGAGGA
jgi:hypothetical protein